MNNFLNDLYKISWIFALRDCIMRFVNSVYFFTNPTRHWMNCKKYFWISSWIRWDNSQKVSTKCKFSFFPSIIIWKGMPFGSINCKMSKPSKYSTTESFSVLQQFLKAYHFVQSSFQTKIEPLLNQYNSKFERKNLNLFG